MEGVRLPHKLYVLCPKSCKLEKYIDDTNYIEFTKDLPQYEIDHGGIAGRKYNVSVYRIKYNGELFYCALEYAQPLKTLVAFKENGRISLPEMDIERESFIKNLTLMLKDYKNSFEVCELVEYDDETEKLHEMFFGLTSVQSFKCQTVE
ncbi:hypothetical protein AVEN_134877-1 [Araneus ventricosus]|uniref:STING ligand-binding domain-containing protein n=1 Tax=Araneus ventricosus TaxID=182803 RepID=A0A4Y2PU42_ARAVE|nr:hypothetical protein AVEN_134877-1 [Araneus ventricosus]